MLRLLYLKLFVYVSSITLPLCAKIIAHIQGFIVLDDVLIFGWLRNIGETSCILFVAYEEHRPDNDSLSLLDYFDDWRRVIHMLSHIFMFASFMYSRWRPRLSLQQTSHGGCSSANALHYEAETVKTRSSAPTIRISGLWVIWSFITCNQN
jgi:hypothetical protein